MAELTTKEVADRLKISVRQVQTLIQRKRLPAQKRGRDWFVAESDLDAVKVRPKTGRPPKPKTAKAKVSKKSKKGAVKVGF